MQSLPLSLVAEDTIDTLLGERAYMLSIQIEVLCDQSIFVGQRTPKDPDVIRLQLSAKWSARGESHFVTYRQRDGRSLDVLPMPKVMAFEPTLDHTSLDITAQTELQTQSPSGNLRPRLSSSQMTCPSRRGFQDRSTSNSSLDPLTSASAKCTVMGRPCPAAR